MTEAQRKSQLFREVNERIRALADRWETAEAAFVCECADAGCNELLGLTVADYDAIRTRTGRFVVLRGHETSLGDHLVEAPGDPDSTGHPAGSVQPA